MIFAIFCIANLPLKIVNDILKASPDEDDHYALWLASNDERISPYRDDMGTVPPVQSIPDAFIGKDVAEVAVALRELPGKEFLHRNLFAVIDEKSGIDGDVMLCHIFDKKVAEDPEDDIPVGEIIRAEGEIEGVRYSAERSYMRLGALSVDHPD